MSIDEFLDNIEDINDLGIPLGHNLYKARIKNTDNNKGKSGGCRLITYWQLIFRQLFLALIIKYIFCIFEKINYEQKNYNITGFKKSIIELLRK